MRKTKSPDPSPLTERIKQLNKGRLTVFGHSVNDCGFGEEPLSHIPRCSCGAMGSEAMKERDRRGWHQSHKVQVLEKRMETRKER